MRYSFFATILVSVTVAVLALLPVALWLRTGPGRELHVRRPGLDRPQTIQSAEQVGAAVLGQLIPGEGKPSDLPGLWPWFRGTNRDSIADDKTPLARQWPSKGPAALWSVELGEGYAGPAVRGGRVYLLDYDAKASCDAFRCLSLADGKEIWRYSYPVAVKRNHGMSRTVPAVTEKSVVGLGPKCHVTCLDAIRGERRWMIDLVQEYGTTVPEWYAGQCPLVDGDRVILAPSSKRALMMAVQLETGQPVWTTPTPAGWNWKMTHASVLPMALKGRASYVYCGSGGVVGVAADNGQILWSTTEWKISIATCPSPVVIPDGSGRIFLSGGYNAGAMMLKIEEDAGKYTAKSLWRVKTDRFGSTQHTPIYDNGFLYGIRDKDKQLVCLDLDGKEKWRSGNQQRFGGGMGPYLIAGGLIYAVDDGGVLVLAEATSAAYKQLARAEVVGDQAWAPMALAGSRLLVRDLTKMVCLEVGK